MQEIRFTLNGREHVARDVDPHLTLLAHLRDLGLTGCKEGCAEGECGACAVALVARGPRGETRYEAVNACLVLLPTLHGREVVSVEGVARGEELHPVQRCMADGGGSQCGYCTPGFVVSLFAEYYRAESGPLDEESIAGNLCRCTGYRPIRDAAHALVSIRTREVAERIEDPARSRLEIHRPKRPIIQGERGFQRPASLLEACVVHGERPELVVLGGGTDLVVEVNQRHRRYPGFLSLEAVPEMSGIEESDAAITIGASVSLAHIEERLHGRVRLFDELLPLFSSRLIRSRATLGGNLGTASPIGDSPPALLALDAEVVVARAGAGGVESRRVPLERFFLDYRNTALAKDELIVAVEIPLPQPRIQRFYKVSKRRADDISTVAAGFALDVDERGVVTKARLAFGGVAATPKRALAAETALVGKAATQATFATAASIARTEFSPMDDHRGTARYRSAMVGSLVERLFADIDAVTRGGS